MLQIETYGNQLRCLSNIDIRTFVQTKSCGNKFGGITIYSHSAVRFVRSALFIFMHTYDRIKLNSNILCFLRGV